MLRLKRYFKLSYFIYLNIRDIAELLSLSEVFIFSEQIIIDPPTPLTDILCYKKETILKRPLILLRDVVSREKLNLDE